MTETAVGAVLIIDDSEDFRLLLSRHLQALYPGVVVEGYDPPSRGRPAPDFPWARFDLVVVDYELGGSENGLDWLRAYHEQPGFPAAVVMTAHGNDVLAVKAIKYGAQDYLHKRDLDRDRLAKVIADVLCEHDAAQQRSAAAAARQMIFDKALFYRRLEETLASSRAQEQSILALTSVDRLDDVHQLMGLLGVDALASHLCEVVAGALSDCGHTVNVTRVGDGSIAALVRGHAPLVEAGVLGARLCAACEAHPYAGATGDTSVRVSVGVVPLGAASNPRASRDLLAQADVAVRMARRERDNSYFVRMPDARAPAGTDPAEALDLNAAIAENRLQPRFQPLASVSDASATLDAAFYQFRVRLVAAQGEAPPVSRFLVDAGRRRTLDRWVIRDSVSRVFAMAARGVRRGGLMVRVSEDTLRDERFEPWLKGLIEHVKAPRVAVGVVFEVRAEDVLSLGRHAEALMRRLREHHGVKFALLDVPSASVLRSCGLIGSYTFIRLAAPAGTGTAGGAHDDEAFADMARTAHRLGAFVVAERVEHARQLSAAIHGGADFVQGFFIQDPQDEATGLTPIESMDLTLTPRQRSS